MYSTMKLRSLSSVKVNGKRPVGRPRTRWTNYIEDLGWNRLGLHSSEMMKVMEDRKMWRRNLELLYPRNPHGKAGNEESSEQNPIRIYTRFKRVCSMIQTCFFFRDPTCTHNHQVQMTMRNNQANMNRTGE